MHTRGKGNYSLEKQRIPRGAAKSEFLQDKNSREGLRNSDFVLGNQNKNKATLN